MDFGFSPSLIIREIRCVSLEYHMCSQDFIDQVLPVEPVEPWNKMQVLISCCLEALAEALKINASVTNIKLGNNKIGAEGAKARCGMGSAENLLNAAACHDIMSSTSCESDKFRWFGGAAILSFIFDEEFQIALQELLRTAPSFESERLT